MSRSARIDIVEDLEALRPEWTALALASGNLFSTWEWASTWRRHHGAGIRLRIGLCWNADDRLIGIVPFAVSAFGPIRLLRFVGHGPADRLAPICAPEDRAAVAAAMRSWLTDTEARSVFVGDFVPREEGWGGLLGATVVRTSACPVLEVAGRRWDEFLAGRSSNFRAQVRSRPRRLERDHDVRYRLSSTAQEVRADLEQLMALHAARWADDGSDAFKGARRRFHAEFAQVAFARGWLRLWSLELDGDVVAAWYGFRYAGAEWYYQSGRDPSLDRAAVGFVLFCHTVRAAIDDGVTRYHLLRGDESYKDRFATADHGLETIAFANGAVNRALVRTGIAAAGLAPMRRAAARALKR